MSFTPFAPAVTIANLTTCVDNNGATWPGGPWMYYATGVSGPACPGEANYPALGITFNYPAGYSNDSNGTYSLVQLISSDTTTGESVGTSVAGLDTSYPYGWPPSGDSPKVYLQPTATSVTRNFTANMFLMWQPNTTTSIPVSIPVPLGYVKWEISGTAAANETNTPPWSLTSHAPTKRNFHISQDTGTKTHGLPTWSSLVQNTNSATADEEQEEEQ